jgi:hypothetical protein
MDGVIAVFWTDLDPGKVTDCPQTHHCGGGGNVYYKKDSDHLVRPMSAFISHLVYVVDSPSHSDSCGVRACYATSRRLSSTQRCSLGRGTTSTTSRTRVRPSRPFSGMVAMCCSSTLTC